MHLLATITVLYQVIPRHNGLPRLRHPLPFWCLNDLAQHRQFERAARLGYLRSERPSLQHCAPLTTPSSLPCLDECTSPRGY